MKLGLQYAFRNPIIRALLILSITAIFSVFLDVGLTWSKCAFDKKPNIPNDVMNINTMIAPNR